MAQEVSSRLLEPENIIALTPFCYRGCGAGWAQWRFVIEEALPVRFCSRYLLEDISSMVRLLYTFHLYA